MSLFPLKILDFNILIWKQQINPSGSLNFVSSPNLWTDKVTLYFKECYQSKLEQGLAFYIWSQRLKLSYLIYEIKIEHWMNPNFQVAYI